MELPDYFVRKISGYPGGIRMPKMTSYYTQYRTSYSIFGYKSGDSFKSSNFGDSLSGGDYRYWCGTYPEIECNKGFARCRCCNEIRSSKQTRKDHKNAGCGGRLEEAYKRLRKTTSCMICQKETHRKVYGLPMCDKDCEFEWEKCTGRPSILVNMLDDIEKEKS